MAFWNWKCSKCHFSRLVWMWARKMTKASPGNFKRPHLKNNMHGVRFLYFGSDHHLGHISSFWENHEGHLGTFPKIGWFDMVGMTVPGSASIEILKIKLVSFNQRFIQRFCDNQQSVDSPPMIQVLYTLFCEDLLGFWLMMADLRSEDRRSADSGVNRNWIWIGGNSHVLPICFRFTSAGTCTK